MKMKKKFFIFAILLITIVAILFIAYLSSNQKSTQSSNFMITYTDSFGYESKINSVPEKIVSLSPNTTEILYYLGLESKIVGRTDYCDFPTTITNVQSVGTINEPNIETIVNLEPDIIITDGMQSESLITSIRNLGFTVIITRSNSTLQGTYDVISDIGLVTNTFDKASQIIKNMKEDISKIELAVKNIENKKTVYYSISLSDTGLYTAGDNTYINELLENAGLINIATDMNGWTYSVENLITHDPDFIICSNLYDAKNNILNYTPINNLTAVKNNDIIEIDPNLIERQSPRNIDGIKTIVNKIYNINID